jgi:membrane-associated phospholipid phosphatase
MRVTGQRMQRPLAVTAQARGSTAAQGLLCRAEWLVVFFFLTLAGYAVLFREFRHILPVAMAWLAGIAAVLCAVGWLARRHPGMFWNQFRVYLTLAAVLCSYRAMDWFAPTVPVLRWEPQWQSWDRALFTEFGFGRAVELAGPLLPAVLEIAYALVYGLPVFCVLALTLRGRSVSMGEFLTVYLLGLYLSYLQFPFWPSRPPWQVFPAELMPAYDSVFRQFNAWVLGGAGIHTSVFPSAHVSGSVAAALAMWRLCRECGALRWGIAVYALLVTLATVYGRYHYAVDAGAGLTVGFAAGYAGEWLIRRTATRPGSPADTRSPPPRDEEDRGH